jgi:hypothetical protein
MKKRGRYVKSGSDHPKQRREKTKRKRGTGSGELSNSHVAADVPGVPSKQSRVLASDLHAGQIIPEISQPEGRAYGLVVRADLLVRVRGVNHWRQPASSEKCNGLSPNDSGGAELLHSGDEGGFLRPSPASVVRSLSPCFRYTPKTP